MRTHRNAPDLWNRSPATQRSTSSCGGNKKQSTPAPAPRCTSFGFPQTLGVAKLKKDLYFGLGVAVVDSDPDAPGLTGWAGWGPESVLFEAKPSEAAAVILTGDPAEGDE